MSIRKGSSIIAGTLNTSTYYTKSEIDSTSNNLVHKSGAETVSGIKTITNEPVIIASNVNVKHIDVTKGTVVSANKYWGIEATATPATSTDSSWQGRRMGKLEWCLTTGNVMSASLSAYRNEAASSTSTAIGVFYDTANSTGWTSAPTPTTSDNSTKIATTAFVRNLLNNHYITAFQAPNSSDNYKWYRKYADGWVEQGGLLGSAGTYAWRTVTLPVTMANTGYTVVITGAWNDSSGNGSMLGNSKTTTGFNTYATNVNNEGSFYVCGMYAT